TPGSRFTPTLVRGVEPVNGGAREFPSLKVRRVESRNSPSRRGPGAATIREEPGGPKRAVHPSRSAALVIATAHSPDSASRTSKAPTGGGLGAPTYPSPDPS